MADQRRLERVLVVLGVVGEHRVTRRRHRRSPRATVGLEEVAGRGVVDGHGGRGSSCCVPIMVGHAGPRRIGAAPVSLPRADHVPRPGRALRRDQGRQHPVRPVVQPLVLRLVVPVPGQRRASTRRASAPRRTSTSRTSTTTTSTRASCASTSTRTRRCSCRTIRSRPAQGAARAGLPPVHRDARPRAVPGRAADPHDPRPGRPRRTARSATRRCSSTTARSASST